MARESEEAAPESGDEPDSARSGADRPAALVDDEAGAAVAVIEGGAVAARVFTGAAFAQHFDLADFHEPAELVNLKAEFARHHGAFDFNRGIGHGASLPRRPGPRPDLDQGAGGRRCCLERTRSRAGQAPVRRAFSPRRWRRPSWPWRSWRRRSSGRRS